MKKVGIGLLAIAMALCSAGPAAADFTPYASVRLLTGWWDYTQNDTGPRDDYDTIYEDIGNFSRFGVKFSSGDLSGHYEVGLKGDAQEVYHRLLYGTWKFGGGSLMVGQNYDPYTFIADQISPALKELGGDTAVDAENYLIGYGCLWDSRQPQIKVMLDNGLYVTAIQPETDATHLAATQKDASLPKMCAGWEVKGQSLYVNPGFAYSTFEADDKDVDSWLLYLNAKMALGPADVKGSLHYGQNVGDFGLWNREEAAYAQLDVNGTDIEDSDSYGGYVQVAMPFDPATITLGVGYTQSENDLLGRKEDEQMSYFVQAKFPVTDKFWVVPEFSYYDQMEDAAEMEEPEAWFAGLLWRMDF
jgi:hypothetical protein